MKKLISLLLCAALCFSFVPGIAMADEAETADKAEYTSKQEQSVFGPESDADFMHDDLIGPDSPVPSEADFEPASYIELEQDNSEDLFMEPDVEYSLQSEVYVNPLYAGVIDEDDILRGNSFGALCFALFSDGEEPEYQDFDGAVAQLTQGLVTRQDKISVYYSFRSVEAVLPKSLLRDIWNAAIDHDGAPVHGDYIAFQHGGASWSCSSRARVLAEGGYEIFVDATYSMLYYDTAWHEAQVDAAIAEALASLQLDGKCVYGKLDAIHRYITENVTYDYTNLNDNSYTLKYTAYAALINHTAVCQGISVLFYRMALSAGIDIRIVPGTGKGTPHAWNLVSVNGTYYYIDATWDLGKNTPVWFLKGSSSFADHVPYDTSDYPFVSTVLCNYNVSSGDCPVHTPETIPGIAPTASSSGLSDGLRCPLCNVVLREQSVLPPVVALYPVELDADPAYCSVELDGVPVELRNIDGLYYADADGVTASLMVVFRYSDESHSIASDMKVYSLSNENGIYSSTHIPEFDGLMRPCGTALRSYGRKGLRIVTGVSTAVIDSLSGSGISGFTVQELGTVVCRRDDMGDTLLLSDSFALHSTSFVRSELNEVYSVSGSDTLYSNLLVGCSEDSYSDEFVFRPYMILSRSGSAFTVYGPCTSGSFVQTALSMRGSVSAGSADYDYIEAILAAS